MAPPPSPNPPPIASDNAIGLVTSSLSSHAVLPQYVSAPHVQTVQKC